MREDKYGWELNRRKEDINRKPTEDDQIIIEGHEEIQRKTLKTQKDKNNEMELTNTKKNEHMLDILVS